MKKFDIRRRTSVTFNNFRPPTLPLKYLRISPLSTITLAGLSTIALLCLGFALHALFGDSGVDDNSTTAEWKPPTLDILALDAPKPASSDIEALSRPIFSKNRKPAPKAAGTPASESAPALADSLSITAIVQNKKSAQVFMVSPDAPEGAWRKIGETVNFWTITAIKSKEVFLKNGNQTAKVELYANPPPTEAPQQ